MRAGVNMVARMHWKSAFRAVSVVNVGRFSKACNRFAFRVGHGSASSAPATPPALLEARPRTIGPVSKEPPVIVFTDGACEADTSIGGVIIDPQRQRYEVKYFGAVVGTRTTNSWKTRFDQAQVTGQAEFFPVVVAKLGLPALGGAALFIFSIMKRLG